MRLQASGLVSVTSRPAYGAAVGSMAQQILGEPTHGVYLFTVRLREIDTFYPGCETPFLHLQKACTRERLTLFGLAAHEIAGSEMVTDFDAAQAFYWRVAEPGSPHDCAPDIEAEEQLGAVRGMQIVNDDTGVPYPTKHYGDLTVVSAQPPLHSKLQAMARDIDGQYRVIVSDTETRQVRLDETYEAAVAGFSWSDDGNHVRVRLGPGLSA